MEKTKTKWKILKWSWNFEIWEQGESFCVIQQVNEKQLTRDEIVQRLQDKNDSIPRKFISMSSNIVNTDPYWKERKHELDSLCFFKLKEHSVFPSYFDTSSCAEHHWCHYMMFYSSISQKQLVATLKLSLMCIKC